MGTHKTHELRYWRQEITPAANIGIRNLGEFQVNGLGSARIRLDVERNALAFAQRADAGCFQRRRMDENVLAAAFRRNETKTFLRIEELHCSHGHRLIP